MDFVVTTKYSLNGEVSYVDAPERRTASARDDDEQDESGVEDNFGNGDQKHAAAGKTVFETLRFYGDRGLFAGRSDGKIMLWRQQIHGLTRAFTMSGHLGPVLSLALSTSLGKDCLLLFTGSSDRTIKIWDVAGDFRRDTCVQTIAAHGGSVTSLAMVCHAGFASSSTDRTIKIWYPGENRTLLMYPWFIIAQTISCGSSWPTTLCFRDGAGGTLAAGDAGGSISLYTLSSVGSNPISSSTSATSNSPSPLASSCDGSHEKTSLLREPHAFNPAIRSKQFNLRRKLQNFHSLGIIQLFLIHEENLFVSLAFDNKAQLFDSISGAATTCIENPNQTFFTACAWDTKGSQLFLGDNKGFVLVWDLAMDKKIQRQKLQPVPVPVLSLHFSLRDDAIVVGFATSAQRYLINRDIGYAEWGGHTGAIVAVCSLDMTPKETRDATLCDGRFLTAGLDNTIRCWDAREKKATFGFKEKDSEITGIAYSKRWRKVLTSHENGCLKAWALNTGQCLRVQAKNCITCLTLGTIRDEEYAVCGESEGLISVWKLGLQVLTFSCQIGAATAMTSKPASASSSSSSSSDGNGNGHGHGTTGSSDSQRDELVSVLFSNNSFAMPGGKEFVVSGYHSGRIRVFHFAKRYLLMEFMAHVEAVTCLALHGVFLFSGCEDGTVKVWNLTMVTDIYAIGQLVLPNCANCGAAAIGNGDDDHECTCLRPAVVHLEVLYHDGTVFGCLRDGTLVVWRYFTPEQQLDPETSMETQQKNPNPTSEELPYELYGQVVFQTRYDGNARCFCYWPARNSVICGTEQGSIVLFELP